MEYRLGTCTSCNARYKVPATFTAARARCKTCGGAVEFGAVLSDVPRPPRQDNPRPERAERPERQERQERRGRREPRREPAPPAPMPSVPRPVRPLPPPEQPAPARSAAPAPAVPAVPATPAAQPDAPARRTPARERASATPARAPEPAQPKGNGPLIVGAIVVSIAVVAAIVWYVMHQRSASAAEIDARAPAPAETPAPLAISQPAAPRLAERALDADLVQMSGFDLSTLPELEPLAGVDAAEQQSQAAQVALFVDESSGDAGRRAGEALVARGKAAMPAILGALKSVDLATETGNRAGERIQEQLLARICDGTTFGWKRGLEPASVAHDQKAIAMWFRAWAAARESDAAWDALAGKSGAPRQ